ncbi:hypothetical protein CKAN_01223000 [Cinnamomum micranthum f. kanehirae]|uniref:Uncharacterized protein n=1 Tax=Cinnamomum micranthum f. kanehirae TaxID=337451 RepID=A0A443NY63_9MAGN|nr:hypothetical protein CKAN_01223000 [Cinnamomum micranthum f. kanehirae]
MKEGNKTKIVSGDEEGRKKVEKAEAKALNPDKLRYIEKKMVDKGVMRLERHPVDGLPLGRGPPKMGHGGKYTWEGPRDLAESELTAPPAIDERDPNYVDEEEDGEAEDEEVSGVVVGEVVAAKAEEAKEGVSRVEVRPPLLP